MTLSFSQLRAKRQKVKVRIKARSQFRAIAFGLCVFTFALSGCRQDMHDQPKYRPQRPIDQIGTINDGTSARPQVEGTVARDQLRDDVEFYTGKLRNFQALASAQPQPAVSQSANPQAAENTALGYQGFVSEVPMPITAADLDRGQERFNIYCSVCHGRLGDGSGMIVKRGFRRPPSFHDERLRNAPVGYFFDVETNGFGAMPDYASQIPPEDRWRIISYIRALQLSQRATVADVPASERGKLSNGSEQAPAEGARR